MLAMTKALKDWRQFLAELDNPFKIGTDHRNLEFWHITQHLTCCQTHWALLLADYNFVLVHKPGKENGIADPLSYSIRFQVTNAEDNCDQLVLNPKHFITLAAAAFAKPLALKQKIQNCSDCKVKVAQALKVLCKKGPQRLVNNLLKWEELDGLLYYKEKLYIFNNRKLYAEIIKTCHDTPTTGHPGKHGMLKLVSRHYWWPKMGASVEQYVLKCDKCQCYKPAQHLNTTLQSHKTPTAPWEHISVDLIT
jgi:hypothetical protein